MKKVFSKSMLILLCISIIVVAAGCGGDDGPAEGEVALVNNYSTSPPKDMTVSAKSNYFGLDVEAISDRFGYRIGYAIIKNGEREDFTLYSFEPSPVEDFKITRCSFIIGGKVNEGEITIQHIQSGEGWAYTSDVTELEIPLLTGNMQLIRNSEFETTLLVGDDLVLWGIIGSVDNEALRPTTIEIFDGYRTIYEALNNPAKADRAFLLLFYITAGA